MTVSIPFIFIFLYGPVLVTGQYGEVEGGDYEGGGFEGGGYGPYGGGFGPYGGVGYGGDFEGMYGGYGSGGFMGEGGMMGEGEIGGTIGEGGMMVGEGMMGESEYGEGPYGGEGFGYGLPRGQGFGYMGGGEQMGYFGGQMINRGGYRFAEFRRGYGSPVYSKGYLNQGYVGGYGRPLYGYGSTGAGTVWRKSGRFRSMRGAKYNKPYYKPYKSGKKNRHFDGFKPRPRKYGDRYMPRKMIYRPELYPGPRYGGFGGKINGRSMYSKRGYGRRHGKGYFPQGFIPRPKPRKNPRKAAYKVRKPLMKAIFPRFVYPVG